MKLKNLKILSEYNNKNIDEIDEEYKNKILNFKFDFIEIEEKENLNFNCIDLFIRLNKNPYPIKINSFEMWNGYINKEIATKIRGMASRYEKIIFLKNNKRMKVEELITSLVYLDFKEQKGFSIYDFIEIYMVENKTKIRIKSKEKITKTLDELYEGDIKLFIKSIDNINEFIIKICILLNKEYNMILNLFSESNLRKSKKDGNFYILWFMLKDMKKEYIKENRKKLFLKISKIFELLQKEVSFLEVKNMIESIRNTNKPIILLDKKEQLTLSV